MKFLIFIFAIVFYCQCIVNAQYYKIHKRPPSPPIRFPDQQYGGQKLPPNTWKMLDYNFPTEAARQAAVANGHLVPENAIPIDVQPHYYGKNKLRTFMTVPRFSSGIPFTLATVSSTSGSNGPKLEAYPNYDFHNREGENCNKMTSAFRVAITECNQMWVIDSGSIGITSFCPPQLLMFDLNTDELVHRYQFPQNLYATNVSLFVTPVVNVMDPPPRGSCRRANIYVADVTNHGLVVYDFMQNDAWRVENRFMYPNPEFGVHTLAGESFTLMDGILGMTTDKRNLYFHPMASVSEYAVPLSVLNDKDSFANDVASQADSFRALGTRSSPCAATAIDSQGNIYCVTFNPIELIVWNIKFPYNNRHFGRIRIDPSELQFVSGMKIVRNHEGREELWMLSNRYQKLGADTQNFNEINFRIVKKSSRELFY